jgi:hypothetical protein
MADNVIHGTGKPRFVLPTEEMFNYYGYGVKTVASATAISVTISPVVAGQLDNINDKVGMKGLGIWTKNSSNEDTWGVTQSYVDLTGVITVLSWSNGNPNAGAVVELKGRYVDLPYCQRLTETFTPDYIVKKMLRGKIIMVKRGFYYSATLDYSGYLHKNEMQIIRYLYESSMNGCGFYPRRDNTSVLYTVDIDPESQISFYQLQRHQGHGGVIINIIGTERLLRIPFDDPTVVATYAPAADDDIYPTADDGSYPTP